MSQNDIVYINFKSMTVSHSDIEGPPYTVKKCKTIKELLKEAKKIQDEDNPEYGIMLLGKIK